MTDSNKKIDLRVVKTHKVLLESFLTQVKFRNFKRVTVNDICEDAQISRATFYSHFRDKYDLLEYWLRQFEDSTSELIESYEELEAYVNGFVQKNNALIKHILDDADGETLLIVFHFLISVIEKADIKALGAGRNAKTIVITHFCAGGYLSYLLWQMKNNFPEDVPAMNAYVFESIKLLQGMELEKRAMGAHLRENGVR